MNRHDLLDLLLFFVFLGGLIVSVQSLNQSSLAIQTAKENNQISYNYYAPSLETKEILGYDANIKNLSGKIVIYNSGGRVINFIPNLYTIAKIDYSNYEKRSYILIYGYYEPSGEETYSSEGLLWEYRISDGYDKFDKVRRDFYSAASEAFNDASLSLKIVLYASYKDFARKNYFEYYDVANSEIIAEQDAKKMITEARENYDLASKYDLSLYLNDIDGEKLFKWWQANLKKSN